MLLVVCDIIKDYDAIGLFGASQNSRYLLNQSILYVYPNSVDHSDVISTFNQS